MSSNRALSFALAAALVASFGMHARAAEDLSKLEVTPQRGQSSEQVRRDRYECHNWAVEQTGEIPVAVPAREREKPSRAERRRRAERVDRIVNGAVIGAGLGGLVRATQDKDAANGVLAGAAVGAAIGAAIDRDANRDEDAEAGEAPSEYLRALSACMEGRGYELALPGTAEVVARR